MDNLTTVPLELPIGKEFTGSVTIEADKILLTDRGGVNHLPPAHPHIVKALGKVVSGDVVLVKAISNGYDVFKFTPEEKTEWEKTT